MNIGDLLADKITSVTSVQEETFSVSSAPSVIFAKHPSIYMYRDNLYCGHEMLKQGDVNALYGLIDMPDAKLNKPQAIWIYKRLCEMAATFSEDMIAVSSDYFWDKETGRLVKTNAITTNDKRMARNGRTK